MLKTNSEGQTMATPNPMPVPFRGNTLYVLDHNSEPFVPMKPIVEGMGMDWRGQYVKLRSNQSRWGMEIISIPSNGGRQESACIPLRKLPGWLMGIHANRVKRGLRDKVIEYQNECDDVLWRHWQKARPDTTPMVRAPDAPADAQWVEGRFGAQRIRAYIGCERWKVCADDLAVALGHNNTFDFAKLASSEACGEMAGPEGAITMMTPGGAFTALARSQRHAAPRLSHYLETELFGTGAIMAAHTPTIADKDHARDMFEEDPTAFLKDRTWLLRADGDGNLHARAMRDDETIVQMEELGQVMSAFDTLESFVNRRELRLAFPRRRR